MYGGTFIRQLQNSDIENYVYFLMCPSWSAYPFPWPVRPSMFITKLIMAACYCAVQTGNMPSSCSGWDLGGKLSWTTSCQSMRKTGHSCLCARKRTNYGRWYWRKLYWKWCLWTMAEGWEIQKLAMLVSFFMSWPVIFHTWSIWVIPNLPGKPFGTSCKRTSLLQTPTVYSELLRLRGNEVRRRFPKSITIWIINQDHINWSINYWIAVYDPSIILFHFQVCGLIQHTVYKRQIANLKSPALNFQWQRND